MIERTGSNGFLVEEKRREILVISLLLIAAFALRAYRIDAQSYSMDEVIELSIASSPVSEIVVEPDGFPPLYHLVLKAWVSLWGTEHSSRWWSVLVGCATILATYQLGKHIVNSTVGLAAAIILAVSPLHVYFSQETRAYATYIALVSLALWMFFAAWNTNKRTYWAGFGLAITASVYTHYYSALLAAILGLMFLAGSDTWERKKRGLVSLVCAAVACLPAILLMRGDHSFQSHGCMYTPFNWQGWGYTIFASLGGFSLGPSPGELHELKQSEIVKQAAPWIAVLALSCGYLGWHGMRRLQQSQRGWPLIFLALAAVPLIGVIGQSTGVGYKVRYVSWTIVPLGILLGAGAIAGVKASRGAGILAISIFLSVQAFAIYQRQHVPRYANEDIRALAATLNSGDVTPGPVFVVSDYMVGPVKYYLNGTLLHQEDSEKAWQVFELPESELGRASLKDDEAVEQALERIRQRVAQEDFWLVYTRSYHGDPEGLFLEAFEERFEVTNRIDSTGALLICARKTDR